MTTQLPGPVGPPPDGGTQVACDLLTLFQHKLDMIAQLVSCRQHARAASDWTALAVLDRLQCREAEDVALLETLAVGTDEAQAVRRWLAAAWQHGELVADENGCQPAEAPPVDRFAAGAREVAPAPDLAGPPPELLDELGP